MERSRRSFLKVAGISALGAGAVGTGPVLNALAGGGGHGGAEKKTIRMMPAENALHATRWGMVIDTRKLKSRRDVEPLIEACHT
ncbi:MAG: 4Fe-4S ferredoxin, partial [Desulfococcaceae bacterium]